MNRFVLSLFAVIGTITVTAAQTPSQINLAVSPIEYKYTKHERNKFWTYAQCPYLLNGGIRTYTASLATCEADCNNHQECTAYQHYFDSSQFGRCELKKCPYPIPQPTGTAEGWTGYALITECKYLTAQLNDLDTSPVTAMERKELLLKKIKSCTVVQAEVPVKQFAKRITENWIANVNYIQSGQIAMSALQKKKVPHFPPQSPPAYLQFDSVASIPERPNQIFLSLVHNDRHLGDVIITLDGDISYPRLGKQMLELSTGNNRKQGSWRGAGFTNLTDFPSGGGIGPVGFPQYIECDAYKGPDGQMYSTSLFPVEEKGDVTPIEIGQVRSMGDPQKAGWRIVTRSGTLGGESWAPIIGHVTTGLQIIQDAIARSPEYAKHVKFFNAGLVISEP